MKIVLWSILALFLVGDAFFVLPVHFSSDKLVTTHDIRYKKDSDLLKKVFFDSTVQVRVNLPPLYQAIYKNTDSIQKPENPFFILVNADVLHDLNFGSLSFPFFKVSSFKGIIPFSCTIRVSNIAGMDSTALVGNITVNGKLSIAGISSPVYARTLVEKELMRILQQEVNKIELDINRRPVEDTTTNIIVEEPKFQKHPKKKKK